MSVVPGLFLFRGVWGPMNKTCGVHCESSLWKQNFPSMIGNNLFLSPYTGEQRERELIPQYRIYILAQHPTKQYSKILKSV